ncbi:MAG TPA: thermonuclease family protein [Casimicrobiaceae bacterium]|nr:thermonuclease family protein [Casimicrobiaceae bacterium]
MRSARPRSSPDARRFALALAALVAVAAPPSFADFSGRVVAVADGDTITVRDGARDVHVRLWGIDAPERGQPWSKRSRQALAARALRQDAEVAERGKDSYGRTLARVVVGGTDLGDAQLADGLAWVYRRYSNDGAMLALEEGARSARRGLWSLPEPEPPWQWRARRTQGEAATQRPSVGRAGSGASGLPLGNVQN